MSSNYHDIVLFSIEKDQFKWVESEQLRLFPSCQRLALARREVGIRLHLDMPFTTHTLGFLLKLVKGEKVLEDEWLPVERVLAELEPRKEPELVAYREELVKELISQKTAFNCIGLWRTARRLRSCHCPEIEKYVLDTLIRSVQHRIIDVHFCRLPMFDVMVLLSNDKLKLRNEAEVFEVIEAWVEAWPDRRRSFLPEMATVVRRSGIPQKMLRLGGKPLAEWKLSDEKGRTNTKMALMIGGWEDHPMQDMTILDYVNQKWHRLSLTMPYVAAYHGTVWLDGELYVLGGGDNSSATYYNHMFKMTRDLRWLQLASMRERRCFISNSCVELDGRLYVMGGHNGARQTGTRLRTVERYDPPTDTWLLAPSMRHGRSDSAAVAIKGKIFVCGGFNGREILASVEWFDPTSQIWTEMQQPMPSPRSGMVAVSNGDSNLMILGGLHGTERFPTVWKTNVEEPDGRWVDQPPMRVARTNFAATFIGDDELLVAGGYFNTTLPYVEFFDGTEWKYGPRLAKGRSGLCCVAVPPHLVASFLRHVV